jgi:hypothetical protein
VGDRGPLLAWRRHTGNSRVKTIISSPVVLLAGAVILGVVGTILLSIELDEGGFRAYHPYDVLGLAIDGVAALLLITSGWRFFRR